MDCLAEQNSELETQLKEFEEEVNANEAKGYESMVGVRHPFDLYLHFIRLAERPE